MLHGRRRVVGEESGRGTGGRCRHVCMRGSGATLKRTPCVILDSMLKGSPCDVQRHELVGSLISRLNSLITLTEA